MVELVGDTRSTIGCCSGKFETFAVDCGCKEFAVLMMNEGPDH
jgi:hypothetical protein